MLTVYKKYTNILNKIGIYGIRKICKFRKCMGEGAFPQESEVFFGEFDISAFFFYSELILSISLK